MFDERWEQAHKEKEWGEYPNEHLVRFVRRTFPNKGLLPSQFKVSAIDLGCGGGAQTLFLMREGFDVTAIDGSKAALRLFSRRALHVQTQPGSFKTVELDTVLSDVAQVVRWPGQHDLVVDVCTLQHLSYKEACGVIDRASGWLRSGGWFFSIMAAPGMDIHGDGIAPRPTTKSELDAMLGVFSHSAVGHEFVKRTNGDAVAHWIVEAQKA